MNNNQNKKSENKRAEDDARLWAFPSQAGRPVDNQRPVQQQQQQTQRQPRPMLPDNHGQQPIYHQGGHPYYQQQAQQVQQAPGRWYNPNVQHQPVLASPSLVLYQLPNHPLGFQDNHHHHHRHHQALNEQNRSDAADFARLALAPEADMGIPEPGPSFPQMGYQYGHFAAINLPQHPLNAEDQAMALSHAQHYGAPQDQLFVGDNTTTTTNNNNNSSNSNNNNSDYNNDFDSDPAGFTEAVAEAGAAPPPPPAGSPARPTGRNRRTGGTPGRPLGGRQSDAELVAAGQDPDKVAIARARNNKSAKRGRVKAVAARVAFLDEVLRVEHERHTLARQLHREALAGDQELRRLEQENAEFRRQLGQRMDQRPPLPPFRFSASAFAGPGVDGTFNTPSDSLGLGSDWRKEAEAGRRELQKGLKDGYIAEISEGMPKFLEDIQELIDNGDKIRALCSKCATTTATQEQPEVDDETEDQEDETEEDNDNVRHRRKRARRS